MDTTSEGTRSIVACLRCRKQKLKCGGPDKIPCQRCRASNAECVFVPPKALQSKPVSQSDSETRIALLEQRLQLVESQLRAEIQELRNTISSKPDNRESSPTRRRAPLSQTSPEDPSSQNVFPHIEIPAEGVKSPRADVSQLEWDELYSFFLAHCSTTVSVVDEQLFSPPTMIREHPLMSTVICAISARAIKPEKYLQLLAKIDQLITTTFQGPTPDFLTLYAILLYTVWTGRLRLLGYVASIAGEMKLHEAALQLGEEDVEHTEDLVSRARGWFTLCSLDLQINISRPLLTSPFHHAVDNRICAYIDGFTITGNVKGQLQKSQLQISPLPQEVADYLVSQDEEIDRWFHQVVNNTDPLYQSFPKRQDRNRFMVPFAFMKLYINGLAMHGVESAEDLISDPIRLGFIQGALDSASLIIQTQFESEAFRQSFHYTMDYNGTPTYYAISFILKAIPIAHQFVDCKGLLVMLQQAARMFEQAGAIDAANELRIDGEKLAALTQTVVSPEVFNNLETPFPTLFDIPSFFDEMIWDDDFPALGTLPFD
ncbi:hypothetical protein ZTR_06494 [Talaromyces verruculosus]|nr:hypothetical protein ZTR_06494 [Talaromyces verruculosus]